MFPVAIAFVLTIAFLTGTVAGLIAAALFVDHEERTAQKRRRAVSND